MFGGYVGAYWGTGNNTYFGWDGYLLNKIVRAVLAVVQTSEASATFRGRSRYAVETLAIGDAYVRVFTIIVELAESVALAETFAWQRTRIMVHNAVMQLAEFIRPVMPAIRALMHGGIRISALVRATLRMNRK